jgi:redox-sensing transcriptional repressor
MPDELSPMPPLTSPSGRTVGRLSLYRRVLEIAAAEGRERVFSHELARLAGASAAQVRRDLMVLAVGGSPKHGYRVRDLVLSIGEVLDTPGGQRTVLVGVGNLGRAILTYFLDRRPHLRIVAAFDNDPAKTDRVIGGCRVHPGEDLPRIVAEEQAGVGVIAVPARAAREVADLLVRAGVTGILNFAPISLDLPETIYVEQIDVTMSLEKVAYYARTGTSAPARMGELS